MLVSCRWRVWLRQQFLPDSRRPMANGIAAPVVLALDTGGTNLIEEYSDVSLTKALCYDDKFN
jgi:hypothetical protein